MTMDSQHLINFLDGHIAELQRRRDSLVRATKLGLDNTTYIVYRVLPEITDPGIKSMDGVWYFRAADSPIFDGMLAVARPAIDWESREDGAFAQVYEIGLPE
jgi:hypothetical protein